MTRISSLVLLASVLATGAARGQTADLHIPTGTPRATPTRVSRGGTIALSEWSVQNKGSVASGAFRNGFYLSTDSTITSADTLLATVNNGSLVATTGSTNWPGRDLTIPSSAKPGRQYVGIFVDDQNAVRESSESNNTQSVAITISGPDLDITTTLTLTPAKAAAGAEVSLSSFTVKNVGYETAPSFSVRFYLSKNSTIDGTDTLLSSTTGGSLAPDATQSIPSRTLTIPSATADGSWYIGVSLDPDNSIAEESETNNTSTVALTVASAADLMTTAAISVSPSLAAAGTDVTLAAWTIKNNGTLASGSFRVGFFLSTDSTITTADRLLDYESFGSLAPAATNPRPARTLRIPAGIAQGRYYVGLLLDVDGVVEETDETNNDRSDTITVSAGPDLEPNTDPTLSPTKVAPGGTVTFSTWSIRNNGVEASGAFTNRFYLSSDSTITTADRALGSESCDPIPQGTNQSRPSKSLVIPSDVSPGSYYVGIIVDADNTVAESDETDNVTKRALTVSAGPDFDVTSTISVSPSTVAPGGSFTVAAATIRNSGTEGSPAARVGYFVSADTIFDSSDRELRQVDLLPLAPANTANIPAQPLTFPAVLPPGVYYLFVVADPADVIDESNEDNNHERARVTASVGADLMFSSTPDISPASLAAGGKLTIGSHVVKNQGTEAATVFDRAVYLSADSTFEATSDRRLDVAAVGGLTAGQTSSVASREITIPPDVTAGTWNLILVLDPDNRITESSETNNTYRRQIQISSCASASSLRVVQVDTRGCPGVKLVVEATTASGQPIAGLTGSNFCLKEDGIDRPFTVQPVSSAAEALHLAIAIDASSSLTATAFADERAAAKRLVDLLQPGDAASVHSFGATVSQIHPFSSDKASLKSAIDSLTTQGNATTLFDAIYASIEAAGTYGGRTAVVVMTDGRDNASSRDLDDVISQAHFRGVPVFTIAFGGADTSVMRELAEQTGGRFYSTASSSALSDIAGAIGGVLNGQYVITYTTSRNDGAPHPLEVCLNFNGCTTRAFGTLRCGTTACTFSITPETRTIPPAQSTGQIAVAASASSCNWSATSDASWLNITGGNAGTGNGTVHYEAAANTGGERTARIAVAGKTFTLTQEGASTNLPDFSIAEIVASDLWGNPVTTLETGRSPYYRVAIRNSGGQPRTTAVKLRGFVDGLGPFFDQDLTPVPGSGASRTIVAPLSWVSTAGNHTVRFVVDSDAREAETNESNNDASAAIGVIAKPLSSTPLMFVPLLPCRTYDSRLADGLLAANAFRAVPITGRCGVPAQAMAVSANFTVTSLTGTGHLRVYPENGSPVREVSTLNFDARRWALANAAIVPLRSDGGLTLFAGGAGLHAIIDVNGYFVQSTPVAGPLTFHPVTPCRAHDTRLAGGRLGADTHRAFPLTGRCGIPADASAVSGNFTVTNMQSNGHLRVYTESGPPPREISTLNFGPDQWALANAAIVPLRSDGGITVFSASSAADVIIDVNGYFAPPAASRPGYVFYTVPVCRAFDTRIPVANRMGAETFRSFALAGRCGIPDDAHAVSANLTVTNMSVRGHLRVYDQPGAPQREISTMNFSSDQWALANAAITPLHTDGASLTAFMATSESDLIIDVNGYFRPFTVPQTNRISNSKFDVTLAHWTWDDRYTQGAGSKSWSNLDVAGGFSGSMLIEGADSNRAHQTVQCVPLSPGERYSFGAAARGDTNGRAVIAVLEYASTDCSGNHLKFEPYYQAGTGVWGRHQFQATANPSARSAYVLLAALPNASAASRVWFDDVFLMSE